MSTLTYCFDLDNTICATHDNDYKNSTPYYKVINKINKHYKDGNIITIYTARGGTSKIDYHNLTTQQLKEWGVLYHTLIDKNKPHFDIFIDDKAINAKTWREQNKIQIVGFVASSFDLLHPGHCLYLKEAKSVCDYLIAALQTDPTIDRSYKNKPIQTLEERKIQLESCKYIDEIQIFTTEKELEQLLEKIKPDIRILGTDAKNKPITGEKYCKQIFFHDRNHNWSSTELRNRI
jgi:glycerol-3-phosphate cytidylyltransferase